MKGLKFIQAVRPDLADMPTNNVQARVTIGFCDDGGVPRAKNRLFVVTTRVERNTRNGDRSAMHPAFDAWNWADPKIKRIGDKGAGLGGKPSVRVRIQHADIDQAYDASCLCFRGPQGAPKPPGKAPYCKSTDMETASRWFAADSEQAAGFFEIQCEGAECPLRQQKLAKSRITLVGRLDEPGFPALLVSISTGSDVSGTSLFGLFQGLEAQWNTLREEAIARGAEAPKFSPYGLPLRIAVFEQTGDESRFPRWHVTLDISIEAAFLEAVMSRKRFAAIAAGNGGEVRMLPPASELAGGDIEALDMAEVLHPVDDSPRRQSDRPNAAGRFRAAVERQAPREAPPMVIDADSVTLQDVDTSPDGASLVAALQGLQAGDKAGFAEVVSRVNAASAEVKAEVGLHIGEARKRVFG